MPYDDNLTITVVDTSDNSAVVIAAHPSLRHYQGVGIIAFTVGLEAGLRIAYEQLLVWTVTGSIKTMALETQSETSIKKKTSIALSDKAWEYLSVQRDRCGYTARGIKHPGLFALLEALIQHNADPATCWRDSRSDYPEQLQMFDIERLNNNQLPLWSQAPDVATRIRKPRGIIAEYWKPLIPRYAALGRHYGISPYRGGSFEVDSVVASATLEAIGLGYLTPAAWPLNPHPVTVSKAAERVSRAREAQRVYEGFSF